MSATLTLVPNPVDRQALNPGGTKPSAILLRAIELLGDRQWHGYEDVLYELAKLIPPGQAMRRTERRRVASNRNNKVPPPTRRVIRSADRLLDIGKRSIALDHVSNRNYFEIDPPGRTGVRPGALDRKIRMVKIPPRAVSYLGVNATAPVVITIPPPDGDAVRDRLSEAASRGAAALRVALDNTTHAELDAMVTATLRPRRA